MAGTSTAMTGQELVIRHRCGPTRNASCFAGSTTWASGTRGFPGGRVRLSTHHLPADLGAARPGPPFELGCPQRGELARQRIGPLRDAAGAEEDHVIARHYQLPNHRGELAGLVEREHVVVAARAHALHQRIAVDARY